MKWFYYDKLNHILFFKDLLAFCWTKRSGKTFVLCYGGCLPMFHEHDVIHMRDIYVQILNYGGYIAWKSNKCSEKTLKERGIKNETL